jgi:hypothetical protein
LSHSFSWIARYMKCEERSPRIFLTPQHSDVQFLYFYCHFLLIAYLIFFLVNLVINFFGGGGGGGWDWCCSVATQFQFQYEGSTSRLSNLPRPPRTRQVCSVQSGFGSSKRITEGREPTHQIKVSHDIKKIIAICNLFVISIFSYREK